MSSTAGPFQFTVCKVCGKEFIKERGSIYFVKFDGHIKQCCSYTCYMKLKRYKESIIKPRREIVDRPQRSK